ncbi:hypothetical protein IEE92_05175 [Kocuria sp. cx-116]|uniref:hypothetical protein n=1 Tax=Kocuria sp. cx-116 TaxID=2771378 RepID=UPI0016824C7D|nr:hypothetical protein [Kocuria sp. cx-116]MBD2761946.1 hypothetical protein [Kocuria sp. cx-116]
MTRAQRSRIVAAQRVLGPKQTGNKNLVYWLYLAGPLVWYGAFGVRELGYAAGSDTVLTVFFLSGSLAILLAPWLPTRYGPVVVSAQELFYFVEGPFGLRGTVLRRTVRICLGVAACAALVSAVIAVGLRMEVVDALLMMAFGTGTAALFASGVVLGGSRLATWARLVFAGLGCSTLGLTLGMGLGHSIPWALTGVVLTCAAAAMLSLPAALDQVTDARLRTDLRSRELLTAGLIAGDLRVATSTGGAARRVFRRSRLALGSHSWPNAVSVDAMTLVRRPFRFMGALLLSFCAGAVVTIFGPHPLLVTLAVVVLQWVFGVLAKGLNDYLESVGADRILPQGVWGMSARHLLAPVVLSTVSLGAGFVAGDLLFLGASINPATPLILLFLPLLIKLSLSGAGALPAEMMTGVVTPMGDLSAIVRIVWMFQGLVPAVLLAVLLQYMSLSTAAWWFIGVLLILALSRLRQLSDIEQRGCS